MTDFEKDLQPEAGTRRLTPTIYVVEKGKPYTYTALGPSVIYVIEGMFYFHYKIDYLFMGFVGEHELEDLTTPAPPIYLTKGDVAITSEGTVVKASSPSKTRGEYTITRSDFLNNLCEI